MNLLTETSYGIDAGFKIGAVEAVINSLGVGDITASGDIETTGDIKAPTYGISDSFTADSSTANVTPYKFIEISDPIIPFPVANRPVIVQIRTTNRSHTYSTPVSGNSEFTIWQMPDFPPLVAPQTNRAIVSTGDGILDWSVGEVKLDNSDEYEKKITELDEKIKKFNDLIHKKTEENKKPNIIYEKKISELEKKIFDFEKKLYILENKK